MSSSLQVRQVVGTGNSAKLARLGKSAPSLPVPSLQVSNSPRLQITNQVSTLCLQVCKFPNLQIRQIIRAGYFAKSARFWKAASNLHALQVSTSPHLQIPKFHVRSPGLHIARSPCLHVPGLQVSKSACPRSAGLHWRQDHGFVDRSNLGGCPSMPQQCAIDKSYVLST